MTGLVELMFFKAVDEMGKEWLPVLPKDVPEWLKEPGTVDFLMSGCVAQAPGDTDIYAALRTGSAGTPNPLAESILLDHHGQPIH